MGRCGARGAVVSGPFFGRVGGLSHGPIFPWLLPTTRPLVRQSSGLRFWCSGFRLHWLILSPLNIRTCSNQNPPHDAPAPQQPACGGAARTSPLICFLPGEIHVMAAWWGSKKLEAKSP